MQRLLAKIWLELKTGKLLRNAIKSKGDLKGNSSPIPSIELSIGGDGATGPTGAAGATGATGLVDLSKYTAWAQVNSGTFLVCAAFTPTATFNTSASFVDATGQYLEIATSTSTNNVASVNNLGDALYVYQNFDLTMVMKIGPNAADLTDVRIWQGVFNGDPTLSSTPGLIGTNAVGFRYSTSVGDTVWNAYTGDGASQKVTATTVTPTVDTRYVFRIVAVSISQIDFYINGTLVASHTASIPTGSIAMGVKQTLTTLITLAKTWRWGRLAWTSN